ASGVSLAAGGLLLAGGLRRSLRPLRSLAQSARQTEFGDLTGRVAVPDTGDEIAKLATEFNIMLERIELAADRQRWLVASVSHELRTPVTIARGHLELLTNQLAPTDKAIETTTILRDELVRLGGMIEDLLAIARADTDDFIRVRRVGLVQWFEDLEFRLAGHPASEQLVIEPPPSVHIEVDPERLTQATINLVSNASRHNPPGTAIRVHATHDNGRISVIVSDNGDGIPDEIRAHLFEPFTRAGDAEGSTGLGLSVVKSVVDAHNGVLLVDSSPHGTTVTIELDTLRGD
ncbi:MAG: HAMP domain-containing sensor histidine kinase, partial [Nitriliruptoraceae bacterium]